MAAEDPNHPNAYMFTGRRFDIEIGLYYYRARYYDPFIGRFLQTDPVGYQDGIDWYTYCGNNPLTFVDPLGQAKYGLKINCESLARTDVNLWISWEKLPDDFKDPCSYDFIVECNSVEDLNSVMDALTELGRLPTGRTLISELVGLGITIDVSYLITWTDYRVAGAYGEGTITWDPGYDKFSTMHLSHELIHAHEDKVQHKFRGDLKPYTDEWMEAEARTVGTKAFERHFDAKTGRLLKQIELCDYSDEVGMNENTLRREAGLALASPVCREVVYNW